MAISGTAAAPSLPVVPRAVERPTPTRITTILKFCRRNPLVLVGATVVVIWILVSIFAPVITPYGPLTQKVAERLRPPSPEHWFGTDALGRDILSRVAYGGRISLPVGFLVVLVALGVGGVLGAIAGFGPGVVYLSVVDAAKVVHLERAAIRGKL